MPIGGQTERRGRVGCSTGPPIAPQRRGLCSRLLIYMAAADTTTIRVSIRTRDRLKALAARRGEAAGDVVAKLVDVADEDALLAEIEDSFDRLAEDPTALAAYRAEGREIEGAFEAPAPEW